MRGIKYKVKREEKECNIKDKELVVEYFKVPTPTAAVCEFEYLQRRLTVV
jgi:hypothetical protein